MVVALHAIRRGKEVLVLVLPEGPRTFLRPLVQCPADGGFHILAALAQGEDLRVRPGSRIPERALRNSRMIRVRLRRLRDLHEPLHGLVRLRQVLDVARDDPLAVDDEHRRGRFAPLVADHGLVLRETNLVGPVLDDVGDRVLTSEGDCLVDNLGCDLFHPITSGARSGGGSAVRPCSRRVLGPDRTCRRNPPRSRGPCRPRRRRTRRRAS